MAKLQKYYDDNNLFMGYSVYCYGCEISHKFQTVGSRKDAWDFNGNLDKPSFSPSMNVVFSDAEKRCCHFFLKRGVIEYCSDTTHQYSNQNIYIPETGLALIVAMTPNRVIGKDNDLPWPKIKEDMKFFKAVTQMHAHVIMGRKTFESIGTLLRKRKNVVVTRNRDFWKEYNTNPEKQKRKPVIIAGNNALEMAIDDGLQEAESPIIIGGAEIYKKALPRVQTMYITLIKKEYEGDTYFPELDTKLWDKRILAKTEDAIFTVWNRL